MAGLSSMSRSGGCRLAVIAGDASGDSQTALLMPLLHERLGLSYAWGVGGKRLSSAGVDVIYDTSRLSAIGFVQVSRMIPEMVRMLRSVKRRIALERPDLLLAVDFGAFNLRLTPFARSLGVPVVYWFPPGSWRKTPPSEAVLAAADYFISPYPWYAELLRGQGARADFLGHPLLDQVKARLSREDFLRRLGLAPQSQLVALLPGSRGHEVEHVLPVLVCAAAELATRRSGLSFVVPLADHYPAERASAILRRGLGGCARRGLAAPDIVLARAATREALCHARAAAICSGSATLEALVALTPMVIVYRGSRMMQLEYKVRRMNISHIGMPNILADSRIAPELRQDEATGQAIAAHLQPLLDDGPEREAQLQALCEVRAKLEPAGALERTADAVAGFYRAAKEARR